MALRAVSDGIFAEVGSAPDTLALHGWGRNRSDWAGVLDPDRTIAVDLPGFGASPPPPSAWGAHGYGDALVPILDLFDRPPIVVGHSFGGRIAVCLAADGAPVSGLVLAGVPLLRKDAPGKPPTGYRVMRWAHRRGIVGDDRMEAVRQQRGSADYRAASGVMRDVLVRSVNESYATELAAIAVPVRMVWGADDTAAPADMAREAAELVADRELEVVDGVGHDIHLARPELVRAAVESLR